MNIIIEEAKDTNLTCKIEFENSNSKYMYSKYTPKNIKKFDIYTDRSYIVLGLGLGYELSFLAAHTNKLIYVIEPNNTFLSIIKNNEKLNSVLDNQNIIFVINNDYENLSITNYDIICNKNIIFWDYTYYGNVLNYFNKPINKKNQSIGLFEHITIAADCENALKNIGFDVTMLSEKNSISTEILKSNFDYIMSINFSDKISDFCKNINKPYISWIVDTPQYSIYTNSILNDINIIFSYENKMVDDLKQIGVKNIYHMPVAANVDRLNNLIISSNDINTYSCDLSFIGNLTISEYSKFYKKALSDSTISKIQEYIQFQSNNINSFVLRELCTEEFTNSLEIELKNNLRKLSLKNSKENFFDSEPLLAPEEKLALLLGREQSYQERISTINDINSKFDNYDIRVYGNDSWMNNLSNIFYGHADHFTIMPKIMKLSKINLNITRTFVDSGLPMRIFDVLGSQGFLLTNYKNDLDFNMTPGKDFIVYRDSQDLLELIEYYLNNEYQRLEIANNGYETVKKYHTYEIRLKKIFDIIKRLNN